MSDLEQQLGPRKQIQCLCGHRVFDGIVVRSRCVRLLPRGGAEAMCRCKRWTAVPMTYFESDSGQSSLPGCGAGAEAMPAGASRS